jgi:galactokinase
LEAVQKSQNVDRLKFVISENNRVVQAISCIKNNDATQLGQLMNSSHDGLSNQYNVSCEELDFIVNECNSIENILGIRMMGGGFGGCAIALKNDAFRKSELNSLKEKYYDNFSLKLDVLSVKSADGCKEI